MGLARLPDGHHKIDLSDRIQRTIDEDFAGRVLPFDDGAAISYADIVVARERRGAPINMADAQIAGICRNHSADLATRNSKDFVDTGVNIVDPWARRPGV